MSWSTPSTTPTARSSAARLARAALFAAALAFGAPAAAQSTDAGAEGLGERNVAAPAPAPGPVAVLQGLDKVTARIFTFEAPLREVVRFGTLEIIPWACHKRPPEEPPESAAFLEIWEVKPGEPPTDLFLGWMFASSPALSALEHPVYDIWVVDCRKAENSASSSSE